VNQFLVDVATQGAYGGTGKQLDWASFGGNSTTRPGKLILAGGLNPDNVAAAIGLAQPHAVDVASGVEGLPGKKDPQLMAEFLKAANDAFTRLNPAHPKN
jgi:phosphoribosylanthranilate isomerase